MAADFSYQSYNWSLGTTSFRMADFHRKVEEQLIILDEFWNIPENKNVKWENNPDIQKKYYKYAFDRGFITGNLENSNEAAMAKTARQKTSGLVDIGLINSNRRITDAGKKLLAMAKEGNFAPDNGFQIPSDSFIYLKQIIKTSYAFQGSYVRPFLVTGKLLKACDGYLTSDEFTYLLPLCINEEIAENMITNISMLRDKKTTVDKIICDTVLSKYSYPSASEYFVHSKKTAEDIKKAGMNRKSPKYDEAYVPLYNSLLNTYLHKNREAIPTLLKDTKGLKNAKSGGLWRELLFKNTRSAKEYSDLKTNEFNNVSNENQFAELFFKYMHLFKIKTNLSDYEDLNRRYLNITDAFIFEEGKVTFTPIFDNFFSTNAKNCFDNAFEHCDLLTEDCTLESIDSRLIFNESEVINVFNKQQNTQLDSIEKIYDFIENEQYDRFRKLIDTKFSNETILSVLEDCEKRTNDDKLISMFGGEADVPTIFEYVVGIAWYRLSKYQGKILEYMNLSLNMNLLPRTHAGGGESDIVYKYSKTNDYPEHTLLIECTLMEGVTQRHGEMEPVTRHLSKYMIYENENAYCAFVANKLHPSVISDFRGKKIAPFYVNNTDHVDTMKIIPLNTQDLRCIIKKELTYSQLYNLFEQAFVDDTIKSPPEWYNTLIKEKINSFKS